MSTESSVDDNNAVLKEENDDDSYIFDDDGSTTPTHRNNNNGSRNGSRSVSHRNGNSSAHTLSMTFMKSLSGLCCQECGTDPIQDVDNSQRNHQTPSELYNLRALQRTNSSISPLVAAPMSLQAADTSQSSIEGIIGEYMCLCQFYKVPYNAGILTTLRFSLPSLRVSGSFHDMDMLALVELLLRHANTQLRFVTRLDFTMASREGKQHRTIKLGFTSHGALALAKCLQTTRYIRQVWLPRHRIGPYGASALFMACRDNPSIHTLNLRRCRIGERGAFAFCELLFNPTSKPTTLQEVDLSSNGIGHSGTVAIERALVMHAKRTETPLFVNLEGNLVFPEVRKPSEYSLSRLFDTHFGLTCFCLVGHTFRL